MKNTMHLIPDVAESRSLSPCGTPSPSTSPKAHKEGNCKLLPLFYTAIPLHPSFRYCYRASSNTHYILSVILPCHSVRLLKLLYARNKSLSTDYRERQKTSSNTPVTLQGMEETPLIWLTRFLAHWSGTQWKKFSPILSNISHKYFMMTRDKWPKMLYK